MKEKNVIEKLLELPEEKLDKIIEKLSSSESDKLMWELQELLFEKLPENCRIHKLKQFIHQVELNIQYNNRHSECYCGKDTKEVDND